MLKRFILPIILFVVLAGLSVLLLDSMANGDAVFVHVILAEFLLLLYYWRYRLQHTKKSGIYYIYVTLLVLFLAVYTLFMSFLYAGDVISYGLFLGLYYSVFGVVVLGLIFFGVVYGGINDSIKNQAKGEHSLSKMKQLCEETMFVLEQNKKDASTAIVVLKEVKEALEYSDPVTHKKVYSIEHDIVSGLKTGLRHAKNKHFHKIQAVMKDSNGVLYLIKKRNTILKESK